MLNRNIASLFSVFVQIRKKGGKSTFSWQTIRKRPVSWYRAWLSRLSLTTWTGHLMQCTRYRTICRAAVVWYCRRYWGWSSKQSSSFSRCAYILATHMDMYKDMNKQAEKCQKVMCHTEKQDGLILRNKICGFLKRNWVSVWGGDV